MATMELISTGLVASESPLARVTGGRGVFFTLDDGREVRRSDEASEFASAVAAAIRELEGSGAKVVRLERF